MIQYAIDGAVEQVRRAFDIAGGKGAININVLWEMGGAQRVLHGVLERTRGMVAGVHLRRGHAVQAVGDRGLLRGVVSADRLLGRAFRALWKRAYSKAGELAGGGGL